MAKLGVYYGLCPLIDHRSLLGISEDKENGVVIVTLGKNIAIKYNLSDQKQLHSWRTKEKFSSPIIYDKEISKYVATFNQSYIRTWTGNEEYIDKLKKLKFTHQIYTIFTCNNKNFILFNNGCVKYLSHAIEKRKDLKYESIIDTSHEYIVDVMHCSAKDDVCVGFIVKSTENQNTYLYWTKFKIKPKKFYKVALDRTDLELTGYVFLVENNSVKFLSLWSDGRLYALELKDSDVDLSTPGELFTVIESILCKSFVSIMFLGENYLAFYGCNCNDEGAILMLYNTQFKVIQSKLSFKLFTNGAKIWCIGGNLLLPVGQNLAVVPFYLETEQLAALVGSHKAIDNDPDISIVQKVHVSNWNTDPQVNTRSIPERLRGEINDFVNQGLSESLIIEQLVNNMQEEVDLEIIRETLQHFTDVPEKCLSNLLKLIINCDSDVIKSNIEISFEDLSLERRKLINLILVKPFSEVLLLPHLRADLSIDQALILLSHINVLLTQGLCLQHSNFVSTEAKLIEWMCTILDANYQKFLLSRDDKILAILMSFNTIVQEELACIEDVKQVVPLLTEVKNGKNIQKPLHIASLSYSVEEMSLH